MSSSAESHRLPPGFEVRVRPNPEQSDSTTVEVAGELCLSTTDRLDRRVTELREGGVSRIVLDLRPVTFLDSTGIRLLVKFDALAQDDGFHFSIIVGDGQPHRVLELVGMTDRPSRVSE